MDFESAKSFEDLIVWQRSHQFVLSIYGFTKEFPTNEQFGLISQLRRAAVSISANIAEGFKRKGTADKLRFLNIAESSLEECRYYLILAKDLGYGESKDRNDLLEEASRLSSRYIRAIEK